MAYYKVGPDCSFANEFESQKMSLLDSLERHFDIDDPLNELESKYITLKEKYILFKKLTSVDYNDSIFNAEFKIALQAGIAPDAMMGNIKQNIFQIVTIEFKYQYNIPQLKNEDK